MHKKGRNSAGTDEKVTN